MQNESRRQCLQKRGGEQDPGTRNGRTDPPDLQEIQQNGRQKTRRWWRHPPPVQRRHPGGKIQQAE